MVFEQLSGLACIHANPTDIKAKIDKVVLSQLPLVDARLSTIFEKTPCHKVFYSPICLEDVVPVDSSWANSPLGLIQSTSGRSQLQWATGCDTDRGQPVEFLPDALAELLGAKQDNKNCDTYGLFVDGHLKRESALFVFQGSTIFLLYANPISWSSPLPEQFEYCIHSVTLQILQRSMSSTGVFYHISDASFQNYSAIVQARIDASPTRELGRRFFALEGLKMMLESRADIMSFVDYLHSDFPSNSLQLKPRQFTALLKCDGSVWNKANSSVRRPIKTPNLSPIRILMSIYEDVPNKTPPESVDSETLSLLVVQYYSQGSAALEEITLKAPSATHGTSTTLRLQLALPNRLRPLGQRTYSSDCMLRLVEQMRSSSLFTEIHKAGSTHSKRLREASTLDVSLEANSSTSVSPAKKPLVKKAKTGWPSIIER